MIIEYSNTICRIRGGAIPQEVVERLVEECSYQVDGAEHMQLVKSGRWDGWKRLYHKGSKKFPTGLLDRVLGVFREFGEIPVVQYEDNDQPRVRFTTSGQYQLRDYQLETVGHALDARRGMIQIATGGGKTLVAAQLILELGYYTLFMVHTKDLLYQAKDVFSDFFGEHMVGQIGDGIVAPGPITVATIQTVARVLGVEYEKYFYDDDEDWQEDMPIDQYRQQLIVNTIRAAGLVIMDECHRVAAPTATDVLQSISGAHYRFGLSASPWRDDGADLALEAVFGHTIVKISATELYDRGYLVRPIIRMRSVPEAFYGKGVKYATVYKDYVVENDERNLLGIEAAEDMIGRGLQTLILVRHISHGKSIQADLADRGIALPFLSGSDNSDTRNYILAQLRDNLLPGLISTTIADEGLDIRPLAGLVLLGGGKSSTRALQRIGRVLRPYPGKAHAEVVDFSDAAKFLAQHSARRYQMYRNEPAWIVTDV